jgi:hypothetical protein
MNLLALLMRVVPVLTILRQEILLSSFRYSGVVNVRRVNKENMSSATIMTISVHEAMVLSLNLSSHQGRI